MVGASVAALVAPRFGGYCVGCPRRPRSLLLVILVPARKHHERRVAPTPVEYHLVSIYSILLFWQKMNRGGRLLPGQAMKEGHQISLLLMGEVQRLDLLGEVRIGGSPFVVKLDHLH